MTVAGVAVLIQAIVWPLIGSFVIPWLRNVTKTAELSKYQKAAEISASIAEEAFASKIDGSSEDKLSFAILKLQEQFPKLPVQQAEDLIHAVLPIIGMGATFKNPPKEE